MATLVGQSIEQPSGRLQKVHVLQPDVFLHCWQQSAGVNTCFACCCELTSKTMGVPSTFCCSRTVSGQHQTMATYDKPQKSPAAVPASADDHIDISPSLLATRQGLCMLRSL